MRSSKELKATVLQRMMAPGVEAVGVLTKAQRDRGNAVLLAAQQSVYRASTGMARSAKRVFDSAAGGSNAAAVEVERKRIREPEKELSRKEKALAEAAALRILRK